MSHAPIRLLLAGGVAAGTAAFAARRGIRAHFLDFAACLATMRRLDRLMGLTPRGPAPGDD